MSKRKKRGRVTIDNANRRLPLDHNYRPLVSPIRSLRLQNFEDRRRWHPLGIAAPAKSFSSPRHRLVLTESLGQSSVKKLNRNPFASLSSKISFKAPGSVLVCVRRRQRREVLHALRKAGKTGQKRPRRSEYSSISCKRKK